MTRVLVTGGSRSGKSRHAESLLAGQGTDYVATGFPPSSDDPEWAARVRVHRERRPHTWTTIETLDIADVLGRASRRPVLVDCLSLWLTREMDRHEAWNGSTPPALSADIDGLVSAVRTTGRDTVLVTNEVGWGVVPDHRSGRAFRDMLGLLNARVAAECDEVWLCVSGIPVLVKGGSRDV
ncbi:MAG: bifunctional adenosylcobinamide kinase/adenosylcobinamide-phosphate guanylyltransferase [Propionibacterium sp.]|nr:bifunctional adenosylcobinamide kinase/adenosylcobinamide-phosphate guanylyltransferase [Propionibacterium sp.]